MYIKIDRNVPCQKQLVTLGDIAKLECADPKLLPAMKNLKIIRFQEKNQLEVFGILKIFQLIHEAYPNVDLVNLGECDFILQYIGEEIPHPLWDKLKLVFLCLLVFFGAAFTIMAFNNDVSIVEIFKQLYWQFMGQEKPDLSVIEIGYSIGLGVGIMVFFNHFGNRKITRDATPIQVELRKTEKDMDDTLIENSSRKGCTKDV